MRNAVNYLAVAVLLCALPAVAGSAIQPYVQNFEGLDQSSPTALSADGWLVYGNVFSSTGTYLYGYGPYPAPNHSLAFSQIVLGEGGEEQGAQVLAVFSDYENADHAVGNLIESNVYREQVIGADDVGDIWRFAFQAKRGNIEGETTAVAFIKTLDPNSGWALTNFLTVDMTSIPDTWGGYFVTITIDPSLANQILQIGFANTATNYEGSGIFYDNIVFEWVGSVDVPEGLERAGVTLLQNTPNPFYPRTRIDFSLERPGPIDLSVFDVNGRCIAVLFRGELDAGSHQVVWNGETLDGGRAASGIYWYTLSTLSGEASGRMVLTE
ncbi:MAG: hypothetical protein KBD56_09545 [Candidatus Eisenbacteria bacterium]|nr:hypothetical protein [Candidatus Eisenbacteria bacterium]